jgi:phospholipid/cholesterol/gamma-HCH transport system ATP-binding protein
MSGVAVIPGTPLFEVRGVHKSFGKRSVLRGVDLVINAGETVTLIGESGSGKSVLLKMLVGLVEPDAGEIRFLGRDIGAFSAAELQELRRRAGYVFQNDALFDSMTVLDNVGYGLVEHTKLAPSEVRERAIECLQMVGLSERNLAQYPVGLSGGMRRRVALARAIAVQPEVVIYDEPMAGLDPQNITRIGRMILSVRQRIGGTSILATHELVTAFAISDRVVLVHDGRCAHVGTPDQLRASPAPEVREFVREALEAGIVRSLG